MAFSATALQLVNRVRRLRRLDDVASIAKTEDLAALDAVNTAIEEVLSSERWEFDLRKSQLALVPRVSGTFTGLDGDTTGTYTQSDLTENFYGDFIVRLNPTGSSNYANTAFRVTRALTITSTASVGFGIELPEDMLAVSADVFWSEYILPDTVRDVVRVSHQEQPITLEQIDPTIEWDELYPRPQIEYGPPETISVGGFDIPTYNATEDEPAPSLRLIVWPVPDEAYVIDYTYYYRHPELAAATDTLEGVPPNVVAKIVEVAAGQMKAFYEKDYNALSLKADARRSLADMHRRSKGQSADRKVMGNWEGTGARHARYPSIVGGRLIGGG